MSSVIRAETFRRGEPAPQMPAGAQARLMFRGPDGRTIEKDVLRYTTLIGSGPNCNIQLLDPTIDEVHCIVTLESGRLRVRDLRSKSGTRVNGTAIQTETLVEGDRIEIGRFSFLVSTNLPLHETDQGGEIPETAAAGGPATAELAFVGPDGKPLSKNILRPTTLIGSAAGCNVQLISQEIGPAHCVLTVESGSLRVRDLRSLSGTRVNDVSVEIAALADGDKLDLGAFSFLVRTNLQPRPLPASLVGERAAGEIPSQQQLQNLADTRAELERDGEQLRERERNLIEEQLTLQAAQTELQQSHQELQSSLQDLQVKQEQFQQQRGQLEQRQQAATQVEEKLAQQQTELQSVRGQLEAERQDLTTQTQAHLAAVGDWEKSQESLKSDRAELGKQQQELQATRTQLEEAERELQGRQQAHAADLEVADGQREELQQRLDDVIRRKAELKAAEEDAEGNSSMLERDRKELQAEQTEFQASQKRRQAEVAKFEEQRLRFEEQQERDSLAAETLRRRGDELETLRTELQAERSKLDDERAELHDQQSRQRTQLEEQAEETQRRQEELDTLGAELETQRADLDVRERTAAEKHAEHEQTVRSWQGQRERSEQVSFENSAQQADIERSLRELESGREALAAQQQQHQAALQDYQENAAALDEQRSAVAGEKEALADGSAELEQGRQEVESALERHVSQTKQLAADRAVHDESIAKFQAERAAFNLTTAASQADAGRIGELTGELELQREQLLSEKQSLQAQQTEGEQQLRQAEDQRQELLETSAQLETDREQLNSDTQNLRQAEAAHESAVAEAAGQRDLLESEKRSLQEERGQLESASNGVRREVAAFEQEWAKFRQDQQAAAQTEEVVTKEQESLKQQRASFDEQQQQWQKTQEEHREQSEQLKRQAEESDALRRSLEEQRAELPLLREQCESQLAESQELAERLGQQRAALEERESILSAEREQLETALTEHQRQVAEFAAQQEEFEEQREDAANLPIAADDFLNGSDEFRVECEDVRLETAVAPDADAIFLDEPSENDSVAAVSTTSLAGGGIGRTQIDWLLEGRRYRGFFIGRYRILELLGTGSTGWLYEAEDTRDGRSVALKVLSAQHFADAGMRARFDLEARALLEANHPGVIRALETGNVDDAKYLAMEVAYGATMQELIERQGPLPYPQACEMGLQAARGLQHIHEAGIIHRDIKPANLLCMHNGELKIIDFGLALIRGDADELALKTDFGHDCMGTPDYIPPEQADDSFSVDVTADIYSLGCTLYFALTGELPFPVDDVSEKIKAHREYVPPPVCEMVSDVPTEVSQSIATMMSKDCSLRYQTAAEVARALKPFAQRTAIYFDFREILESRAATAKKRMFMLANRDMGRTVTNTAVNRKTDEKIKTAEPELAGP